jgi:hypothetical protein
MKTGDKFVSSFATIWVGGNRRHWHASLTRPDSWPALKGFPSLANDGSRFQNPPQPKGVLRARNSRQPTAAEAEQPHIGLRQKPFPRSCFTLPEHRADNGLQSRALNAWME